MFWKYPVVAERMLLMSKNQRMQQGLAWAQQEDLTTVHISSWEQRLDWRSFLSEAGCGSWAERVFQGIPP